MGIDISVLVVTYNSDLKKTLQTLHSILVQKNVFFEIVIADDGSKENNFAQIELYLNKNHFSQYTLIANAKNKGTVANVLSGLKACKGQYVKDISPGDFLYDENTLSLILHEISHSREKVYFGKAVWYSTQNGKCVFYKLQAPRDVSPYKTRNYKKLKRNYLIKVDYILGAAFICETQNFLSYLTKINGCVKYAEDFAMAYMVADGIVPSFIEHDIVWYEYGTGISTVSDSSSKMKMREDTRNFYELLKNSNLIPKYIYDLHYAPNILKRLVLTCFIDPARIVKRFCNRKVKKIGTRSDEHKLMLILGEGE